MSELGEFLKQTREEKGFSINDIQEKTKIRRRYIEAIENGDYPTLPGQFYARAFIKSYAEVLGLPSHEVLEKYAGELPKIPTAPVDTSPISRSQKREMRKSASPMAGKWVSRILFYIFLIFLVFMFYVAAVQLDLFTPSDDASPDGPGSITGVEGEQNSENEGTTSPEDENESEPIEEPEVEPAVEPELTFMGTQGNRTEYEFSHAEIMEVTLEALNASVWLALRAPEESETIEGNYTLNQGETETWDLTEYTEIELHIGNMRELSIMVNDLEMDLSDLPNSHYIRIFYIPNGDES